MLQESTNDYNNTLIRPNSTDQLFNQEANDPFMTQNMAKLVPLDKSLDEEPLESIIEQIQSGTSKPKYSELNEDEVSALKSSKPQSIENLKSSSRIKSANQKSSSIQEASESSRWTSRFTSSCDKKSKFMGKRPPLPKKKPIVRKYQQGQESSSEIPSSSVTKSAIKFKIDPDSVIEPSGLGL